MTESIEAALARTYEENHMSHNYVDLEDEAALARFLAALISEGLRFRVEHRGPSTYRVSVWG